MPRKKQKVDNDKTALIDKITQNPFYVSDHQVAVAKLEKYGELGSFLPTWVQHKGKNIFFHYIVKLSKGIEMLRADITSLKDTGLIEYIKGIIEERYRIKPVPLSRVPTLKKMLTAFFVKNFPDKTKEKSINELSERLPQELFSLFAKDLQEKLKNKLQQQLLQELSDPSKNDLPTDVNKHAVKYLLNS